MVRPVSSLRHRGVMVVPQFWQAITTVVFCPWSLSAAMSIGDVSSGVACASDPTGSNDLWFWLRGTLTLAVFDSRLL